MSTLTKVDQLHDLLKNFNTRKNPNWNALVTAIGQEDENTAQLVAAVRQQFFIKTASRPYLDRLASNVNVSRPHFLGMTDAAFQKYIPVLSYQPKQVKHIIDQLLGIFFEAESTTAFIVSSVPQPYNLHDGWSLQWIVDQINEESIVLHSSDFTDITNATAEELVATINRQTQFSYATVNFDNVTKNSYVKIFSNTIGSKGSLQLEGGLVNSILQFNGFNQNAGNGSNTQWSITKIGQTVTCTWIGGTYPGINTLQIGDIVTLNLTNGSNTVIGSFPILSLNLATNSFTFNDLFAGVASYTQTDNTQVKFFTPNRYVAFTKPNRAMTWEPSSDNIIVELPASPPVVRRSLIGSQHVNGLFEGVQSTNSSTSLTLIDATEFPNSGNFIIQPMSAVNSNFSSASMNGRLIGSPQMYAYTGRSGNQLTGISPNLPPVAGPDAFLLSSLFRTSNVVTGITSANHNYQVGETVIITGSSPISAQSLNGSFPIISVTSNTFTYNLAGVNGTPSTPGNSEVERVEMANSGSFVILADSISSAVSKINGAYIWDSKAPFVLSSNTATTTGAIKAGQIVKLLTLSTNTIPSGGGSVVFDYGLNTQEGPVRYLYAPNSNSLVMDPSYTFLFNHPIDSNVTAINNLGPHVMSGIGTEYPPYVTDPTQARLILEDLIISVKSAGIFVEFLVKYPEQFYSIYDVYDQ